MTFTAWNEGSPAGSDPAGQLAAYIDTFKVQVRERLATVFTDWATATDRITVRKLFVDAVNGLDIRNATDTTSLASITKDGWLSFPFNSCCFLYNPTQPSATNSAIQYNVTPTEVCDPQGWHNPAGTPWRIIVPAGMGGTFLCFLGYAVNIVGGPATLMSGPSLYYNNAVLTDRRVYTYCPAGNTTWCFGVFPLAMAATDYVDPYYNHIALTTQTMTQHLFGLIKLT